MLINQKVGNEYNYDSYPIQGMNPYMYGMDQNMMITMQYMNMMALNPVNLDPNMININQNYMSNLNLNYPYQNNNNNN